MLLHLNKTINNYFIMIATPKSHQKCLNSNQPVIKHQQIQNSILCCSRIFCTSSPKYVLALFVIIWSPNDISLNSNSTQTLGERHHRTMGLEIA